MKLKKDFISYLIVVIAPLCWAGDVVLAKGIINIVPPFTLAFWRWALTFLFLIPFSYKYIKKDFLLIKDSFIKLIFLSFLGMSGFIVLIYKAVQTTTAINSALIQTAMPGAIVLFCLLLYKEKISIIQVFGLSFCFLGAAYVILKGNINNILQMSFVKGDILIAIASIMYGLYSALLQRIPKIHTLSFLTISSLISSLTLLPLYLYDFNSSNCLFVNKTFFLGIIYVALFPSIIAYLCWNKGISTIGANKTGIFISLTPIFASILAILFLGETIKFFHIIGMIMIFIGVIIFNKYQYND
jgi:drug/metabolite transporter (DMT)-like permease